MRGTGAMDSDDTEGAELPPVEPVDADEKNMTGTKRRRVVRAMMSRSSVCGAAPGLGTSAATALAMCARARDPSRRRARGAAPGPGAFAATALAMWLVERAVLHT